MTEINYSHYPKSFQLDSVWNNQRNTIPLSSSISFTVWNTFKSKSFISCFKTFFSQVDRASTFKIIGKDGGIGVPLPESSDVPEGHNVHLLEIKIPSGENLGISLVPTSSTTDQHDHFFQVYSLLFSAKKVDWILIHLISFR